MVLSGKKSYDVMRKCDESRMKECPRQHPKGINHLEPKSLNISTMFYNIKTNLLGKHDMLNILLKIYFTDCLYF